MRYTRDLRGRETRMQKRVGVVASDSTRECNASARSVLGISVSDCIWAESQLREARIDRPAPLCPSCDSTRVSAQPRDELVRPKSLDFDGRRALTEFASARWPGVDSQAQGMTIRLLFYTSLLRAPF